MTQDTEPSGARRQFGDFAPALADFTDDVLFGQVWTRTELSPKERSLVTDGQPAPGARPAAKTSLDRVR